MFCEGVICLDFSFLRFMHKTKIRHKHGNDPKSSINEKNTEKAAILGLQAIKNYFISIQKKKLF